MSPFARLTHDEFENIVKPILYNKTGRELLALYTGLCQRLCTDNQPAHLPSSLLKHLCHDEDGPLGRSNEELATELQHLGVNELIQRIRCAIAHDHAKNSEEDIFDMLRWCYNVSVQDLHQERTLFEACGIFHVQLPHRDFEENHVVEDGQPRGKCSSPGSGSGEPVQPCGFGGDPVGSYTQPSALNFALSGSGPVGLPGCTSGAMSSLTSLEEGGDDWQHEAEAGLQWEGRENDDEEGALRGDEDFSLHGEVEGRKYDDEEVRGSDEEYAGPNEEERFPMEDGEEAMLTQSRVEEYIHRRISSLPTRSRP